MTLVNLVLQIPPHEDTFNLTRRSFLYIFQMGLGGVGRAKQKQC